MDEEIAEGGGVNSTSDTDMVYVVVIVEHSEASSRGNDTDKISDEEMKEAYRQTETSYDNGGRNNHHIVGVVQNPSVINRNKHLHRRTLIIDFEHCMRGNLKGFGCKNICKYLIINDYRFTMGDSFFDRFRMVFPQNRRAMSTRIVAVVVAAATLFTIKVE